MTTAYLPADIKRDEGLRLHAYPDPRTGAAPWTCGYGCTGEGIGADTVWTQAEADVQLTARLKQIQAELDLKIAWWRKLSDPRQDVLANMAYNLGVAGLMAFHTLLADCEAGLFTRAAAAMLASDWARQVHARAERLATQMRTGERP